MPTNEFDPVPVQEGWARRTPCSAGRAPPSGTATVERAAALPEGRSGVPEPALPPHAPSAQAAATQIPEIESERYARMNVVPFLTSADSR
jgi:hypothetical protein